jgi:hypothetical protein
MGIIAINVNTTGLIGEQIQPRRCTLITTDNLATITTAGYLNNQNSLGNTILPTDIFEVLYSFNEQTQVGTFGIFQVTYSSSTGFTLNLWENPGNVLLPVVSGDFAIFNGTTGQIKDAGFSPSDPAKTKVVMAGSAVVAARLAKFVDTAGTVDDTAGAATNLGDIYAGASGTAGALRSYPATATTGYLSLTGVANAGNFAVVISNASHAQSTTYTINDIGAATGGIPVATAPFIMKQVAGAAAAGGAAAQSFTDAFCTSSSNVIGNWNTQANAASVLKIVPGNGSFVVTSSADAGVGTFNYIIMK